MDRDSTSTHITHLPYGEARNLPSLLMSGGGHFVGQFRHAVSHGWPLVAFRLATLGPKILTAHRTLPGRPEPCSELKLQTSPSWRES
jgi:hypothetical protein